MAEGSTLVIIFIILLGIGILVSVGITKISQSYATAQIALKAAAAKDIALIIDSIYASPYDMVVVYGVDLSKFIVEISQNHVKLYDTSSVSLGPGNIIRGNDIIPKEYSFVPVDEEPEFIFDKPRNLIFSKEEGRLTISKEGSISTILLG